MCLSDSDQKIRLINTREHLNGESLTVFILSAKIRGFPTIKVFRKGEEPEDYQGGRSRRDIIERALDLFSDNAPPPELLEVSAVVHLCQTFTFTWK